MDVEQAVGCLRAAGRRITEERVEILRAMAARPHADAREIYALARTVRPKLSLSTVYRTVNLLRRLGVAGTSGLGQGHRHYEARHDAHYHCVCLACGRVIEVAPIDAVRRYAKENGFHVVEEDVELVGYCSDCVRSAAGGALGGAGRRFRIRGRLSAPAIDRFARETARIRPGEALTVEAQGANAEEAIAGAVRAVAGVRLSRLRRQGDHVVATVLREVA